MAEQQRPEQPRLKNGGVECPRNDALIKAIGSQKKALIRRHEQAYIMVLCATPNGCDLHFILQAVNAHHSASKKEETHIDPKIVSDHLWELTQRGIIERNVYDRGKYRVKPEAIQMCLDMVRDNEKRSGIVV